MGTDSWEVFSVDSFAKRPSIESRKLELLRRIIKDDVVKREILSCLCDGLWHSTMELARHARARNPVIGIVTVGSILGRMQEQLGEDFLEQMVQNVEEGVASWRLGIDWLEAVKDLVRKAESSEVSADAAQAELQNGQPMK